MTTPVVTMPWPQPYPPDRSRRKSRTSASGLWWPYPRTEGPRLALKYHKQARRCKRAHHATGFGGRRTGFLRRSNLTAWVRAIRCNAVYITRYRSMHVPVSIRTRHFMANKKALVDSRATDNFIHPTFAKRLGWAMTPLDKPKRIYNIDNTSNKAGSITHSLELKVTTKGIDKVMRFFVTDIGNKDILLGYPWLATFEPKFGWKDAIIETSALPIVISSTYPVDSWTVIVGLQTQEEKEKIVHELEETTTIRGIATELAIQAGEGKKKVKIPAVYGKFKRLFSEEASHRFPPSRPWDHTIELKPKAPDTIPCKVYLMTPAEDKALCYVTVGTFTRHGLDSTKQWHWVFCSVFWVLSPKGT